MGKLHLLDKFLKEHFLIPINLRLAADSQGLCHRLYCPSLLNLFYI